MATGGDVYNRVRKLGFHAVNCELIYGIRANHEVPYAFQVCKLRFQIIDFITNGATNPL